MKKPSKYYTCYGTCYCDCTLWWMLGELNTKNLLNTLLNVTLNNMIVALLPSTERWAVINFLLIVIWIVEFWALGIRITSTLIYYLTILIVSLQIPFLTWWCGCLYGCKFKWVPCFLGGHNICERHMYLHTHELSCNSYMPRWTLRGGGEGLPKGVVKQRNYPIQTCS